MFKELLIPFSVAAVIASLLVPLPAELLDILLIANLLSALALLMSALSISDATKLSTLPTMLLLATLYRLGLNVSTTRLILSKGEAGQTIEAFGTVVIQGSLIAGTVVFLVITLIQFIVIAKGAERVAEVCARFVLDALPGKQMSIDADVRAGLIDQEGARRRREELQLESRFYGSLDGAMKFVKGDAIAGLVITAVNCVGGLVSGVLVEGLDISSAVSRYTTLTIGDGLVTQIPALLNALAAGMVVTRVSRNDGVSLAQEVLGQLGQFQRVKIMMAILSLGLAFAPGMPSMALVLVAFVCVGLAISGTRKNKVVTTEDRVQFTPKVPAALQIEFGQNCWKCVVSHGFLPALIEEFRQSVFTSHGLILALPEIDCIPQLQGQYCILLHGVPVKMRLQANEGSLDPKEVGTPLKQDLQAVVAQHAPELIDDLLTRRTLDLFERQAPELVSAVIPAVVSVTQLTELLRALCLENVNIRNFDVILQAVAEHGPKATSERVLLEEVRIALRRQISSVYVDSADTIRGLVLDPTIDVAMVKAEREAKLLDPELIEQVIYSITELQQKKATTEEQKCGLPLLVSRGARRLLKQCLVLRDINLTVLAHEEIAPGVLLVNEGMVRVQEAGVEARTLDFIAGAPA